FRGGPSPAISRQGFSNGHRTHLAEKRASRRRAAPQVQPFLGKRLESSTLIRVTAGERLGPYEILALIGAGGMGEVYKARDTRLDREVAIKVAAEQFSQRFEGEARAIAALSHPHICALHDIGPNYLVMEYIEGETLEARIKKGPLPANEALKIAI